jgi:hypothetical protein
MIVSHTFLGDHPLVVKTFLETLAHQLFRGQCQSHQHAADSRDQQITRRERAGAGNHYAGAIDEDEPGHAIGILQREVEGHLAAHRAAA